MKRSIIAAAVFSSFFMSLEYLLQTLIPEH